MRLPPVAQNEGLLISKYLWPLDNEYIVASHEEFRYALWKNGVRVLIYVGGSLNECVLQRDAGINLLAGADGRRVDFTIIVLEDCTDAMETPRFNSLEVKTAMLDYYMFKMAVVSNLQNLFVHALAPNVKGAND